MNRNFKKLKKNKVNPCVHLVKSYRRTLCLWFFTFGVALPFLAQRWVFSPFFFISEEYKTTAKDKVDDLNKKEFQDARTYLSALKPSENRNLHLSSENVTRTKMMAMVITKKRANNCVPQHYYNLDCEPHYLQQTLVGLDKEAKSYKENNPTSFVPTVICNVDPNWKEFADLGMVKDLFPVIYRYLEKSNSTIGLSSSRPQETSDYAFCLESILNHTKLHSPAPAYVLILEDDAVPFRNFFYNLFYIMENRLERNLLRGEWVNGSDWSFLKLYYPELWAGFGIDFSTLLEIGNLGLIGALVGILFRLIFYKERDNNFKTLFVVAVLSAIYCVLLARILSRQTLLEVRRIHPYFFKVSEGPGCCTPAVVYPTKGLAQIIEYLRSPDCEKCYKGVDLALDDYSDNVNGLVRYLVEPNLVRHIGFQSTLTTAKNAVHMLFYDLLYD